jgi:SAM-dependent methyltransferase
MRRARRFPNLRYACMAPDPTARELDRLRATWRTLGTDDPLWAILSRPDKRGGRWNADEFFAAGESEIGAMEAFCSGLGRPREHRLALDFGCGVGRISRALASRYADVVGIDIASSMLDQARRLNGHLPNVRFIENATPRLPFADASADLVYSVITLHHMPRALQRAYISEFLRVLAPHGLAAFQIASGYSGDWRGVLYRILPNRVLAPLRRRVHDTEAAAEMHTFHEPEVEAIAAAAGRRRLLGIDVDSAGRGFRGRMLFVG